MDIDIPNRKINLRMDDKELQSRRDAENARSEGWSPQRDRQVSEALKAYALLASSADKGAVRSLPE